jgi:hypothetical protein
MVPLLRLRERSIGRTDAENLQHAHEAVESGLLIGKRVLEGF